MRYIYILQNVAILTSVPIDLDVCAKKKKLTQETSIKNLTLSKSCARAHFYASLCAMLKSGYAYKIKP